MQVTEVKCNSESIIRAAAFKMGFSWIFKVQDFILPHIDALT